MPIQPIANLDIPKCNILSYLFPPDQPVSEKPQWIDAGNPQNSVSAKQALLWVKRLAVGLDKLGIGKNQAVMVFTPNHIMVPLVYLAAAGSGRCFSGANPVYTANEVAYQMKNIEAAIVFIHPSLLKTGLSAAKQAGISKDRLFQFSDLDCETVDGVKDWRTIVASAEEAEGWKWDPLEGDKALETVATINFSSGTTGLPKGVCITHRNLIANAEQTINSRYTGTPYSKEKPASEIWLAFLPLYHAYSQLYTINISMKLRIPAYVMRSFVFTDYLKYIQKYKVTHLQTVPPILIMLSKRPETAKYDLSTVENILCGAAPLSGDLQNDISKKLGAVVLQGWGMTETTCGGIGTPGTYNDMTGSIGSLIANTEAMLVDEDGKEVDYRKEEPGELWVRGPQMMLKYWRNEKATKESKTEDGWLKTGDVAIHRNGKFWIVDRKKELVKVNGLQVAPAELEAVLLENEEISDAAVVGITLESNELPRAYVVLQEGVKENTKGKEQEKEKEIQKWMENRVAKHKRLVGGVVFVDEIPRLASGKIMRKIIKEWSKRDAKMEIEKSGRPKL